jgi:hypothetical protein
MFLTNTFCNKSAFSVGSQVREPSLRDSGPVEDLLLVGVCVKCTSVTTADQLVFMVNYESINSRFTLRCSSPV